MNRPDLGFAVNPDKPSALLHCTVGEFPIVVDILDAHLQATFPSTMGDTAHELNLGVYVVRFTCGRHMEEVPVMLRIPGERVEVTPSVNWRDRSSVAPDVDPALVQAMDLQHKLLGPVQAGHAYLLVIIEQRSQTRMPGTLKLSLEDGSGKTLHKFIDDLSSAYAGGSIYRWSGPAGMYRIRSAPANMDYSTAMQVALAPNRATHVFLQTRRYGDTRAADLPRANIAMPAIGSVRAGDQRNDHFITAARESLELHRADGILVNPLWGRAAFADPMVGLMRAHLLLRAKNPPVDTLLQIVKRLEELLGPLPDVRALRVGIRMLGGDTGTLVTEDLLRNLSPIDEVPFMRDACALLLRAQAKYGGVISEEVERAVSEADEIASSWLVRKRIGPAAARFSLALDPVSILGRIDFSGILDSLNARTFLTGDWSGELIDLAKARLVPSLTKALPAGNTPLEWDELARAAATALAELAPELLDRLADQLRPFERNIAETLYPAINPLNRAGGVVAPLSGKAIGEALMTYSQTLASKKNIAFASERARQLAGQIAASLALIIQLAGKLKGSPPG